MFTHRDQELSQAQLDVLTPVLNDVMKGHLQPDALDAAVDAALLAAGLPVCSGKTPHQLRVEAECERGAAQAFDPRTWSDKQVLEFLGVALRNVEVQGEVRLSEIRQGFQFMSGQPITADGKAATA